MMVNKVCLLLLISTTLMSQDLLQLRLIGQPEKSANEFVGANIKDANERICMAIKVISDMEGFKYTSNNGIVKVDDQPGQDMVYVSPDEMVLEIFHTGYEPLKVIFSEHGILAGERAVWTIRVAGDKARASELAITIITDPGGAEVFIDDNNRGAGEQQVVAAGTHRLRLTKPGYETVDETIQVTEKNTLFRYKLKKVQDVILLIESAPAGAEVFIDDVKLGVTPLSAYYAPGRGKLRLVLDWYLPYEEELQLTGVRLERKIQLRENYARLTVTSAPESGLDIYLNDLPQQSRTPFTFARLAPGSYRVRARSAHYETQEESIALATGEQKSVTLNSTPGFATLTVKTTPGAVVFLNGQQLDRLENIRLQPSVIVLRAELAKAPAVEERVTLRKGESRTVELVPIVPTGTIQVAVMPFEAKVELRGDGGEYYTAIGAKMFADIPLGSYTLKVSLNGYTEKQETMLLKEGEKLTRSVLLEKHLNSDKAIAGESWRDPKTGIEFVLIKGGTFQMGDLFGEGDSDEKPVHTVTVSDFYLGKSEVTVGQYRAFCKATGRRMPDAPSWGWKEDHPIVRVSWNDAVAFCQWLGCRLPTEEEWEYAAREGGRKVRFGNGKDIADPAEINFDGSEAYKQAYSRAGLYRAKTTAVAGFAANSLGLYDMSGNVWEWCADWCDDGYYQQGPEVNPQGSSLGQNRVLRGGSWDDYPNYCRASNRSRSSPGDCINFIGFRVARPVQ